MMASDTLNLTPLWYPFKGMLYFGMHPTLAKHVLDFILHAIFSQLVIALVLGVSTFNLQSYLVSTLLGKGLLNTTVTVVLLLAEALLPLYFFLENISSKAQGQLFKATLAREGVKVPQLSSADKTNMQLQHAAEQEEEAQRNQKVEQQPSGNSKDAVKGGSGSAVSSSTVGSGLNWLWSTAVSLVQANAIESRAKRYLRTLVLSPLLAIFPFGAMFVAWLNGLSTAQLHLKPYWEQKGLYSHVEQEGAMERHRQEYQLFGATAALLEMIPVLNWLCSFSTTIGAALLVADMERTQHAQRKQQ